MLFQTISKDERGMLLISTFKEGYRRSFDNALMMAITRFVIASLTLLVDLRKSDDSVGALFEEYADAFATADILNYNRANLSHITRTAESAVFGVRSYGYP